LGQLVMATIEPQQQTTLLNLSALAEGIYLVKVDQQTFKVVKK
jgi:hypothetical protein